MWFWTILFWIIFLAGVFLVLISLLENKGRPARREENSSESALQILNRRFASGEIDETTFKRMKSEIEG